MDENVKSRVGNLREKVQRIRRNLEVDVKEDKIAELDNIISGDGFWDNNEKAQKIVKERTLLSKPVEIFKKLSQSVQDIEELFELSDEEGEEAYVFAELTEELKKLEKETAELELNMMLSGEHAASNAIVSINSGAGGTESQDWAQMLMRMYLRWCERRGLKTSVTDLQEGDEAGLKSVTFTVSGENAYGYLTAENGVHRLVRISPFDSNKRRHTSFASVFISPEIEEAVSVTINEDDLKIDTYRSSGAGGQHVNVTDSAVRITHIPTGVVVQCQNERSQHKNKATAMSVLRSKLYEIEKREHKEMLDGIQGEKKEIGWGSQIRSYVLHPYRMVKDLRTKVETGNTDAVMDGDSD
ncbi:MAG: peptide chain release factor 2, partial [Nitrospinota bacterium]